MDRFTFSFPFSCKPRFSALAGSLKSSPYRRVHCPLIVPSLCLRHFDSEFPRTLEHSLPTTARHFGFAVGFESLGARFKCREQQRPCSFKSDINGTDQCLAAITSFRIAFSMFLGSLALSSGAWAVDLEAADNEAFIGSTYDPVVTVVFGIIVLCLVVVTGGVLYLSFLNYLDERKEREDKAKFEQAEKDRKLAALSPKNPVPRAKKADDSITTRGAAVGLAARPLDAN
eukprot:jgi/Botrbrau1/5108/Bobra.0128s0019.1